MSTAVDERRNARYSGWAATSVQILISPQEPQECEAFDDQHDNNGDGSSQEEGQDDLGLLQDAGLNAPFPGTGATSAQILNPTARGHGMERPPPSKYARPR